MKAFIRKSEDLEFRRKLSKFDKLKPLQFKLDREINLHMEKGSKIQEMIQLYIQIFHLKLEKCLDW